MKFELFEKASGAITGNDKLLTAASVCPPPPFLSTAVLFQNPDHPLPDTRDHLYISLKIPYLITSNGITSNFLTIKTSFL